MGKNSTKINPTLLVFRRNNKMAEKEITRQSDTKRRKKRSHCHKRKKRKGERQAKLILAKRTAMVNRLNSVESVVAKNSEPKEASCSKSTTKESPEFDFGEVESSEDEILKYFDQRIKADTVGQK